MLRHFQSTGSGDKRAGGGDINAVAAVATGADDVGKQVVRARERRGVFQQRGGGAGNFLRLLAAHFHTDQRGGQLFRLHFAAHDGGEQLVALLLAQGFRLVQLLKDRLEGVGMLQLLQRPGQGLLQQSRALGGEDRFRVELEAAHPIRIVTHRHHHAIEIGVNRQPGRNIAADQRVVARHRQRVSQTGKHRLAVVLNAGGFTVKDLARLADIAAVGFDNSLVAEADADDRQLAPHAGQQFRHAAGFAWRTRARGEHQHRIVHGAQTLNQRLRRNGVTVNHHVMAVGAQLVCQVIGERIDIIEQQNVSHQKISFA